MPLGKQLFELPIAKGLGQKVDPRLVKVGAHTTLTNLVQDKMGSLQKRPGILALNPTQHSSLDHTLNQYDIGDSRLVPNVPGGLAQVSGLRMWARGSIASGNSAAYDLDDVPALVARRYGVNVGSKAFLCFDIASDGTKILIVWIAQQPGGNTTALYAVLDATSLEPIVPATTLGIAVSGINPTFVRLASTPLGLQNVIAAVFQVGTNLAGCTFTFSTLAWTNSTALVADCNTTTVPGTTPGIFAVTMPNATTAIVSYGTTAATPVVQTNSYPVSTWVAGALRSVTPPGAAGLHIYGIDNACDAGSRTWVAYSLSGGASNAQRAFALNTGLLTVLTADTLLWTETSTLVYRLAILTAPAGYANACMVFGSAVGATGVTLNWCTINTSATVTTPQARYGLALAGKPWCVAQAKNMVLALYNEGDSSFNGVTVQRTYYALEVTQRSLSGDFMPHACIAPRIVSSSAGSGENLPNVIPLTTGLIAATRFLTLGCTIRSAAGGLGVDLIDLQYGRSMWQPAKLGGVTYLSGGVPCAFDGQRVTEIGFLYQPPSVGAAVSTTGGLVGPAAGSYTYTYSVVYEWRDASGQRCQSRPTSTTATCTTATSSVTLTIPPLNLSLRQDFDQAAQQVAVAIYRDTATSQGNQVRIFSADVPAALLNQYQSASLSYLDTAADTAIGPNEGLYTSGGNYDDVCPSSLSCLIAHNERLAGIGDDGASIWMSTEYDGGTSQPRFNDGLIITIGDGGPLVALSSMDGQLVAFKRDSIFLIAGDGPAENGGGNAWNAPQKLSSDVGCSSDWRSVVAFSGGVAFQNGTKLYLLSRSLEVSYFSGPIEDTLAANPVVKFAVVNVARNELRFGLAVTEDSTDGVVANYNYVTDTWSLFNYFLDDTGDTSGAPLSALVVDGVWYAAEQSGIVVAEHPSANGFDVDSVSASHWITYTAASAWAVADGIQSFKRFWDAIAMFHSVSPCDLTISVGYNYADAFTDVRTFTAGDIAAFSTPQPQMAVSCTQQKGSAARIQVSDAPPSDVGQTNGSGANILSMGFLLGLKGGRVRLPPNQGA